MRTARYKRVNVLLIIALFGLALTFFGNFYECAVFVPNLMGLGGTKGILAWRAFFVYSNPIYFYIPLGVIGFLSTFISYAQVRGYSTKFNKCLRNGTVYAVLVILITVVIVTQFNLKLFFPVIPLNVSNLSMTLLLYYVTVFIRLIFDGFTLNSVFRAYTLFISEPTSL